MEKLLTILILFSSLSILAQQISIDRGVRVNGIWCFPLATNEQQYRYLPATAKLSKGNNGLPVFSFLRYVDPLKKTGQKQNTVEVVEGGGILSFTIEYTSNQQSIKIAENRLKEHFQDDELKILGPIIFSSGQFQMVSSIVRKDAKGEEKVLLGTGTAPVLEGSRIPFSFNLTPTQSKLLLENFRMPTPDIAVNIELQFSGLTDAYNAELTVNWDEVEKYRKINAGAQVYFVNAEVEHEVQELFTSNSIQLKTSGADEKTEALLNQVYQKVTELLFEEESIKKKQDAQDNPLDIAGLLSGTDFNFLSINAGYKQRNIKRGGKSRITFDSRNTVSRNHYIVFNIGNLFKEYGENNEMFKTVNLEDPAFLTRTVQLGIDGELYPEFGKLINNVTVQLRKKHKNGETTIREARIIGSTFQEDELPRLEYPWRSDTSKLEWLGYDYKAMYQFTGGEDYETDWSHQDASMINLYVPYTRRNITLIGDTEVLKRKGVRAIQVVITYPFFGEDKIVQKTIKTNNLNKEITCEITLPRGVNSYKYDLSWYMNDGAVVDKSGEWKSDILFVDELN